MNADNNLKFLNAMKSLNVAAKALEVAARTILELQEELNKPVLTVVEKEKT